jgi:hypothetical protein
MSRLGSATVCAEDERGSEVVKLDFCAYCADWAVNTLMRRTMLGKGEEKQERAMDKLEFDLTAGKLRRKGEGDKKSTKKDGAAWTAELLRKEEKSVPTPPEQKLVVKGPGAAEKRAIFEKLLRYKETTGPGWAIRIEKASGGAVSSETVRSIVVDGVVVDIAAWRKIGKAIDAMKTAGASAT